MTIEELLHDYFRREAEVSELLSQVERAEAEKTPIPMPSISVPNYAEEVIRPILKMLAGALPENGMRVPPRGQCALVCDSFPVRTEKTSLGVLSYPTKADHRLYFSATFHRKAGPKQEIKTLEQLVSLVKAELNKRGLLILPQYL